MGCDDREATEAAFVHGAYTALCSECREATKHLVPGKTPLAQHVVAFAFFAALLGIFVWVCKRDEEPTGATNYNRGLRAIQQGDAETAIAALTEAISIEPAFSDAYALRGEAHCMLGQCEQGIADYTEAIRLVETGAVESPELSLPLIYNDRGQTYYEIGNVDLALTDFAKAVELDRGFALAYNNRGFALASKGQLDEAIADYGRAIRLDRTDFRPFFNRGIALLDKRQHNQALPDLDEAVRLNPQCTGAWVGRADARLHRGEYREALADANQALHLAPELAAAHTHRFVAAVSLRLSKLSEPHSTAVTPAAMRPPGVAHEQETDGEESRPPSARRVVSRAIVLSALVYRSFLDHYAGSPDGDELRSRLLDWLVATGLVWELEQEVR
jgi:tetratricopeptide (TPR) repeat protein